MYNKLVTINMLQLGDIIIKDNIQLGQTSVTSRTPLLQSKGKGMFLYSAVSSLLDRSKRFTLFLPWQTCSFRHQLDFSGKHSSHSAIAHEDYSLVIISTTISSQVLNTQLGELGHRCRQSKEPKRMHGIIAM